MKTNLKQNIPVATAEEMEDMLSWEDVRMGCEQPAPPAAEVGEE